VRAKLTIGVAALSAMLAGCSSGKTPTSQSPAPQTGVVTTPPATSASPSVTCTDESSGSVFNLTMENTSFHPPCVIAKSAQSIHIDNKDGTLHNFTITGTQVDVDVQGGQTFNGESAGLAPGTYSFFCKYHRSLGMAGTIVVK
jgi:plastocyanin